MNPQDAATAALEALLQGLPQTAPPASQPAAGTMPADQRLRDFFRSHPRLGKRERLQVGDLVFDVLRNLRLYRALAAALPAMAAARAETSGLGAGTGPVSGSGAASGAGSGAGAEVEARALVAVAGMMAAVPSAAGPSCAAAHRQALPLVPELPDAVRYSLPDWLWERLQASHGARAHAIALALLQPSPIDIRANLLVGKAGELARRLREQGIEAEPIDGVPTGLRVVGRPNLEKLDLFERGWFEIQDAGSQRIVDFCQPRRGQLVVDFCAGGGGKTLAIAARMRNVGKVLAFDTGDERLARLMPRARRAGVDIVEPMRIDGVADARLGRYRQRADLVLVDAPCSGTGTLRRSPDLKWRLSQARLLQHVQEQRAILDAAAALVKPGGRLVYATCSLLREENEQQVADFSRPGFEFLEANAWLPDEGPSSGFFAAKWLLQGRR